MKLDFQGSIYMIVAFMVLSILFFPAASRPLAWTMLGLSITLILIAVVGKQVRLYKQGKLTRPQLAGRIGFEVTGVLLCAFTVVLAAGYAAWLVTRLLGVDGASLAGRVIPLGVSLLVGLPLGWLFQKLWGGLGMRVMRAPKAA
jgi:hypothetical protein